MRPVRLSKAFVPTLKEAPADAQVASHKLLVRAGFIRQLGAGIYDYLPLAKRTLSKIEAIVREEMDAIGGQEFFLPALHPANRPFYDAGRGLAWCLNELGKRELALEVVAELLRCDPTDPLGLRGWIDEINTGGAPIVELT